MRNMIAKIFLISMLGTSLVFGATSNANSVTNSLIEKRRQENVDKYVQRLNYLLSAIIQYMNETGDSTPTRAKVQAKVGVSNEKWTNFAKEACTVSGDYCSETGGVTISISSGYVYLSNVIDTSNAELLSLFTNSVYYEAGNLFNKTTKSFYMAIPASTQTILDLKKEIDADNSGTKVWVDDVANLPTTCSTSTLYYIPNGNGGVDIYKCAVSSPASYKKLGTVDSTNTSANGTSACVANLLFTLSDTFNATTTPGSLGMCAKVETGGGFVRYTHNGTKWVADSAGSSSASIDPDVLKKAIKDAIADSNLSNGGTTTTINGGDFYSGTGTIYEMATTKFDLAGGSKIFALGNVDDIIGKVSYDNITPYNDKLWSGVKSFTKYIDGTSGYWTTDDFKYVITKDITSLNSISSYFLNGTVAWIKNQNSTKLHKLIYNGTKWVYQKSTLNDLFIFDESELTSTTYSSTPINVISQSKEFILTKDVMKDNSIAFTSTDNKIIVSYQADRNQFNTPKNDIAYLMKGHDCTSTTCNGIEPTYYSGAIVDTNFYTFYQGTTDKNTPTTTLKHKNTLTDASTIANMKTLLSDVNVNSGAYIVLSNTTDKALASGGVETIPSNAIVILSETKNGGKCWSYNGQYIISYETTVSGGYAILLDKKFNNDITNLGYSCVGTNSIYTKGALLINATTKNQQIKITKLEELKSIKKSDNFGYEVSVVQSSAISGIPQNTILKYCKNSITNEAPIWSDDCNNLTSSAKYYITTGGVQDIEDSPFNSGNPNRLNLSGNTSEVISVNGKGIITPKKFVIYQLTAGKNAINYTENYNVWMNVPSSIGYLGNGNTLAVPYFCNTLDGGTDYNAIYTESCYNSSNTNTYAMLPTYVSVYKDGASSKWYMNDNTKNSLLSVGFTHFYYGANISLMNQITLTTGAANWIINTIQGCAHYANGGYSNRIFYPASCTFSGTTWLNTIVRHIGNTSVTSYHSCTYTTTNKYSTLPQPLVTNPAGWYVCTISGGAQYIPANKPGAGCLSASNPAPYSAFNEPLDITCN